VPIVSIIEGNAASAATIISMVCHKRYITKHSFMLIHQLSSACAGTFQEIQDDFTNDTKFMDVLYKLYQEHTSMTPKKIKEVLKHDIWWSSDECIDSGLVDGLWDSNSTSISVKNHCGPYHFTTTWVTKGSVTEELDDNDEKINTSNSKNTRNSLGRNCKNKK